VSINVFFKLSNTKNCVLTQNPCDRFQTQGCVAVTQTFCECFMVFMYAIRKLLLMTSFLYDCVEIFV
jgi:hypothetical protein